MLAVLLENPGEITTREELQTRLWPDGTFVDFEKGVNTAVKKLRAALGDSTESPIFIETIPRRGYRFIAPVRNPGPGPEVRERSSFEALPPTAKWIARYTSAKRLGLLALLLGLVVLPIGIVWFNLRSPLPIPRAFYSAQITKDGLPKEVTLKLLSDGTRLYFQEGSFTQNVALVEVSLGGGETSRIPVSLENLIIYDISSSRSELLASAGAATISSIERPLWIVPLPIGSPYRVGDILAHDACWAPDGRHLVFAHDNDLFIAKADGSEVRKFASPGNFPWWLRFSPDGSRLRFSVPNSVSYATQWDVMETGADGSGLHRLPILGIGGTWSADGKSYFYLSGHDYHDIWVQSERRSLFGKVELGNPVQLTAGPIEFGALAPSADGKRLSVVGNQPRIELVHYDSKSKQFTHFLGGISAGELEVSPDGQWVVYTTYPESTLWRSKLDGSERLQLTFVPVNAHEPRWSPDGKKILFVDFPWRLFVVPADGGTLQQLMPADRPTLIGAGAWLPDGNSILFAREMGCPVNDSGCNRGSTGIYQLDLKTQQVTKLPGSDRMIASRLSRDGRYVTAVPLDQNKMMLYDFRTQTWSELVQSVGSIAWSHNSKFVYLHLKHGSQPASLVRISVADGKVEKVLDLKGITLGGFWPDWVSLLPDDSPLLMLDKSTQEIYRLDLQFR